MLGDLKWMGKGEKVASVCYLCPIFMTEEQIQNIILTKKYPFTWLDLFDHYSFALFFLIIPAMFSYYFIKVGQLDQFSLVLSCIGLFLALFIFLFQGPRQGQFKEIKIEGKDADELYKMSEKIFSLLKWKIIESNQTNYIKAFRSWDYSWGANRGQEITVIIADKTIYVISLYSRLNQATPWKNQNHRNLARFNECLNAVLK